MPQDQNSSAPAPSSDDSPGLTADERSQAIHAGFDEGSDTTPPARPAAGEGVQPAAAPSPASGRGQGDAAAGQETPDDPFASFGEPVRKLFADFVDLKQQVRSMNGRYGAVQRELDTLKRGGSPQQPASDDPSSAPAPARPRIESVELVRGELPEVAQAIEDAVEQRIAHQERQQQERQQRQPAAEADDDEVAALAVVHPDWAQAMNSPDFKLWLTAQADGYADKVLSTNKSAIVSDALSRFKGAHLGQRQGASAPADQRRASRVAAAVQPPGSGRGLAPPPPSSPSYSDLVRQGFDDG